MSYDDLLAQAGMSRAAAYQMIQDRREALIAARYPALT